MGNSWGGGRGKRGRGPIGPISEGGGGIEWVRTKIRRKGGKSDIEREEAEKEKRGFQRVKEEQCHLNSIYVKIFLP